MLHQDPKGGFWPSRSLNGVDPESVGGHFMTDASTAFASLALAEVAKMDDNGASNAALRPTLGQ
jgi:hypothetical protein